MSPENDSNYDWRRDGWLAACALTAILLVFAAATSRAPGFETFLRLFVFGMALVRGFAGFRRGGAWLPLSAALIAILFNPAKPVASGATASGWLDLIGAAWFALVGAWRLLRSWEPQRGWAAAALSLCALAVPAVAAFSAPNRDALDPATVNEGLAEMNAAAPAPPAPSNTSANAAAPEVKPAPAENASASTPSEAHAAVNALASQTTNRVKPEEREVTAKTIVPPEPPLASRSAASPSNQPTDIVPLNNSDDGNVE